MCREGMRSLAGLRPLLLSPSLRHRGEGLLPWLQRAGERQVRRRAENWRSSSPSRLLREPHRTGLCRVGSSSLRWVRLVGEGWSSSSSSRMECRGFSGLVPLSG